MSIIVSVRTCACVRVRASEFVYIDNASWTILVYSSQKLIKMYLFHNSESNLRLNVLSIGCIFSRFNYMFLVCKLGFHVITFWYCLFSWLRTVPNANQCMNACYNLWEMRSVNVLDFAILGFTLLSCPSRFYSCVFILVFLVR